MIHTKQAQYRTYVVGAPLSEAGETPRAMYWDMDDPYHYARIAPGGRAGEEFLIVGGEDHKTGQQGDPAQARWDRLEAWARERFAGFGRVSYRWSGQVVGTNDGLAFIGRNPGDARNVFIATGDCGHGMTHGTIAGLLLPALIAGRRHPWEALYDPSRVRAGAVGRWARENLNAAAQYGRHLRPGEAASVDDVAPGTGAVVRRGLSEIAVYRDADGSVVERSAICPHLGAVVCWNSAEKTWDCPAHGSRFATDGTVLNGPAAAGLAETKAPRPARAVRKRRAPARKRASGRRAPPRFGRKTA
ncbi:MAG: FAD-dependent oxidoreductase [Elusimicrobiota bacterium]|nr:MAG: FAD-dependent oxidoreductase [Elusimicrobiota bacterium]